MCSKTRFDEVKIKASVCRRDPETDKPLWVRKHSCPLCGFTADRGWNAAWNILSRGIKQLGAGRSESTSSKPLGGSDVRTRASLLSTPVETALPTGTTTVPAKRVVETGSPITRSHRLLVSSQNSLSSDDTLNEATSVAE